MNSKTKKIINGMLVGTMVFSMVGLAFADNQLDAVDSTKFTKNKLGIQQRQDRFKSILDQIIEKGILTEEQADHISQKLAENKSQIQKLTFEEMKVKLEEKVSNGEITQEKANEILKRMESKGDKAGRKKADDTETRESLTLEKIKTKLEDKVANGEITQEKADQILKRVEDRKVNIDLRLNAIFSPFVEDETITQEQLNKIIELFK
ncbi:hypothetical protein [Maledivibacter halophilus]|uniref:CARD domain-containing protein n=1 Tax=Maledivibacter halophilus TaxID=36842 RepID=A0A1T5J815_9FIRM|nr:hypothetical protein [Maledivibacter halophilus]SKC47398.1 hypothetical protein SAMN02194393_00982 [Maledivibacter halophilus]